ncbi:MAG: hypothetical protein AB7G76_06275 [Steroidobacteraceae bacterium]
MPGIPFDHPILTEPAPCDGCPAASTCAAQQRACTSFALYLAGYRESRWRAAPRTDATHERYLALDGQPAAPAPRRRSPRKPRDDALPIEWLGDLHLPE